MTALRSPSPFQQMTDTRFVEGSQHLAALSRANTSKAAIAQARAQLKELRFLPRHDAWQEAKRLLLTCPEGVEDMPIWVFLEAIPGFGYERVRRTCQSGRTWPLDRVGQLTYRERKRLAERVGRGGWGVTK